MYLFCQGWACSVVDSSVVIGMVKHFLLLSSLFLSAPVLAGTQAAQDAAGQDRPAVQAAGKAQPAANDASGGMPSSGARKYSEPHPLRQALLAQRYTVRRNIFQLRANRDSELSRLSLARLAVSRGGETADKKTDKELLDDMRRFEAEYDQLLEAERAKLAAIDARLARLDDEQGKTGKAVDAAVKPASEKTSP